MRRGRGLHHLEDLLGAASSAAARNTAAFDGQVREIWVFGALLDEEAEFELVSVAIALDRPSAEVPLRLEPAGASHWANATRMARQPIECVWRSVHAPVWNHLVRRPLRVWESSTGRDERAWAALVSGDAEALRAPEPSPEQWKQRLREDSADSLAALRRTSADYSGQRWAPGRLERLADPLAQVARGYLELLDALGALAQDGPA